MRERLNHRQSTARTAVAKRPERSSYVTMTCDDDELILQMQLFIYQQQRTDSVATRIGSVV